MNKMPKMVVPVFQVLLALVDHEESTCTSSIACRLPFFTKLASHPITWQSYGKQFPNRIQCRGLAARLSLTISEPCLQKDRKSFKVDHKIFELPLTCHSFELT